MTSIQSIQLFVAINLFTIGISHFLQPKIWIEFFEYLYEKGNVGNIINALIALGMGSIILSFHFVWEWPAIIVTLYGLLQIIKGITYLTIPSIGLKSIGKVNKRTVAFRWVGLIMCLYSIFLIYHVIRTI